MHPSPPETRASLILRLRSAADVAAWDEFSEIYAPAVFRVASRHGLQPADADDLVQEVLVSVARSVSDWLERENRGRFRAWLFRIARNTAVDFLTKRKFQPWGIGGEDAAQSLKELAAANDEMSSDLDIEYRREVFRWASDHVREAVSESTWQAFWLTSVEQRPISEVAKQLGRSVGSVYIARSRVMKRLRMLAKQFEEISPGA